MIIKERPYYWNDGNFYYGQWLNNKIHGVGVFISSNQVIIGQFNNGFLNGYCQIIDNNKFKFSKYYNGQHCGLIKYEYYNGETIIDKTNSQSIEEFDIINQLNHQYFIIMLKTQLKCWKLIQQTQIFFQNEHSDLGLLYDIQINRFEYGQFLNQQLNGKGGIIFESGDRYFGELKNGQLNGTGIFYDKLQKQYTQSRFLNNQVVEIIKKQKEPIQLRNQWHQIQQPELFVTNIKQQQSQNKGYQSQQCKSISPMRPTSSIKKQAMYSTTIKNYPNLEYKFGSIQHHFCKDDLQIILPKKNRTQNSYIKQISLDEQSIKQLKNQLY